MKEVKIKNSTSSLEVGFCWGFVMYRLALHAEASKKYTSLPSQQNTSLIDIKRRKAQSSVGCEILVRGIQREFQRRGGSAC